MSAGPSQTRLKEILRQEDLATLEEMSRAHAQSAKTGESLAEVILKLEILDEEDLFFLLSQRLGVSAVPEARLLHLTLSPDLRRRVPRSLARRGILVPFDIDKAGRRLSVAMLDPSDGEIVGHLRHVSGVTDVHVYLARRSVILAAIDVAYGVGPDVRDRVVVDDLALTDPEPQTETQVELIPGKVSLDPELLREMAAISPRLVEESLHAKSRAQGSPESPHVIRPGGRGPRPSGQRGPAVRPRVTPARGSVQGRPPRAASRPQNMPALPQNMPALPKDAAEEPIVRRPRLPRGTGLSGLSQPPRGPGPTQPPRGPGPASKATPGEADDEENSVPAEQTHERLLPEARTEAPLVGPAEGLAGDAELRTRVLDRRDLDERTPIAHQTFEEIRRRDEKTPAVIPAAIPAMDPTASDRPGEAKGRDGASASLAAVAETPVDFPADDDDDFAVSGPGEGQTRVDGHVLGPDGSEGRSLLTRPVERGSQDTSSAFASVARPDDGVFGGATPPAELLETGPEREPGDRGLMADLVLGIEALIGLLEQRVAPDAAGSRECGQLASRIAWELDLGDEVAHCAGVAAQLFALDGLLRRERGGVILGDLVAIFDVESPETGGINQDLRRVGARCLGLDRAGDRLSDAALIVALIRDYMDLRSSDPESDIETVLQLLRTGGADSLLFDALTHAVDRVEGRDQRTERRKPGAA